MNKWGINICIDLSRFKVVYDGRVLNALSLQEVIFPENQDFDAVHKMPQLIEIIVINSDGNIEMIKDETWKFQFIPIIRK